MTRAMSYDVIQRRSHRGASHDALAIIAQRLAISLDFRDATSRMFVPCFTYMFSHARPSRDVVPWYEIAQPLYDFILVQMLTSASRQTIILKSYDLIRLSYDGRTMSYYFHKIIYVP